MLGLKHRCWKMQRSVIPLALHSNRLVGRLLGGSQLFIISSALFCYISGKVNKVCFLALLYYLTVAVKLTFGETFPPSVADLLVGGAAVLPIFSFFVFLGEFRMLFLNEYVSLRSHFQCIDDLDNLKLH
ncbi:hypothetical protein, unlikely [Trypanosoma brucei gambiense DAL972]|uniref:Uncharacterized protein n=1 Tax=Trypanosoma brucei gambiense (strain MHOM/CI/86/DAL972) TaxID=679716 RepID=D0A1J0_TRYB9|nr:hypothetical protein, unlikely [Trypanosoma brucei gambiense DAL972]CBH15132.1 hypothetical protein, unlikely [Trypanosoma brucei gambiense DAL972]|eukprot:XP_011777398.1 hypothetical protein, unlikely [Trypanosoma brucei gambiense DAL972]